MTSGVRIRPARASDAPSVASFTRSTFAWGDYVADAFQDWLIEPGGGVLVAEVEGSDQAVGLVHAVFTEPGEAWFEGLRVHPEFRRRGVADALNLAAQDWAAARGARVVRLAVDEANGAARRQVEHLGFEPLAEFVHAEAAAAGPYPPGPRRARAAVRLALPGDAAAITRTWTASTSRGAAAGLWGRGWRWWSADADDLGRALRSESVLAHPQGFAVLHLATEPAELRWLECRASTEETRAEAVRELAVAVLQAAYAAGRGRVRALLPDAAPLADAIASAGFERSSRLVVYAGSIAGPP